MIPLWLQDVASMGGGSLDGDVGAMVTGVATDSRRVTSGDLFVALHAERDGHEFLADAAGRGAVAALVRMETPSAGLSLIRVADPLAALARLATQVRLRLSARAVAVTGSSGKTCTKDFIAAVLGDRFRVTASEASFNNEIGVPLTVLAADDRTQIIIAEIGARGAGHIRSLAPVVKHEVAVVTNVGVAHHGMFGSIEAIAEAKGELVETVPSSGVAVLNAEDSTSAAMAARCPGATVTFGSGGDVRATNISLDDHARAAFMLELPEGSAPVILPVPGEHMVSNALAAAAVGRWFGMEASQIAGRLAGVSTGEHRMRLLDTPGGIRIIDDSYNANPASMVAGLKALVAMGRGRGTWAVLGPMAELGSIADEEHDRIGRLAVRLGVGRLVTVGDDARAIHEAARLEGMNPEEAVFASDADTAAKIVLSEAQSGDVVLVKASRAAGLERVVEAIAE